MKKYKKQAMSMMTTGIGLGVGSSVLGDMGSTYGQQAVGKMSKAMPMMGTMTAGGMVIDSIRSMDKSIKMKKKM